MTYRMEGLSPEPFEVELRGNWGGWALPSRPGAILGTAQLRDKDRTAVGPRVLGRSLTGPELGLGEALVARLAGRDDS